VASAGDLALISASARLLFANGQTTKRTVAAVEQLAGGLGLRATVFTCLVVGTIVTPIADRLRLPFAAFAFASVVSLIPGVFLFRMADGLAELVALGGTPSPDLLFGVMAVGTTAILIVMAMTFGLIFPKMCIDHFYPGFTQSNQRHGGVTNGVSADPPVHRRRR
jgi:uncharacterized membrane protein YjjB (DUF3815 family)